MMINQRLINLVSRSKRYIAGNVIFQWIGLAANIVMMFAFGFLLERLISRDFDRTAIIVSLVIAAAAILVRCVCIKMASKMSFLSSKEVKHTLREKIYRKLLRLGTSYNEQVSTSAIVQDSVEGVEQLEVYFGSYLPQFFYSMLAPVTLFVVLSFINWKSALVLLCCVPLIPILIAAIQTFAKRLVSKYWGSYTDLGGTFLENLQGLTTLKIYQADADRHVRMNEEAEKFRKMTMRVLMMQLNSIIIMDLVAFGGAAVGLIMAVTQYRAGGIYGVSGFVGCFVIIMLAADFFLPLRSLGSFFHVAMNGMAASAKIFELLDAEEPAKGTQEIHTDRCDIDLKGVRFSYEEEREILHGVDMAFKQDQFTAIVGESGCGKSTIAALLMSMNKGYQGSITVGGQELSDIREDSLMRNITLVSSNSYLFKGTVRENLLMGDPNASEERMNEVLRQTKLDGFLRTQQGLDTPLAERASNLSGGQCQRLALARALLHDSPVYIFDEATSNIDVESENDIMDTIRELARTKTVILISHRLANVVGADRIYVLESGSVAESGTHEELLAGHGLYSRLWNSQMSLEHYAKEGA